MKSAPSFSRCRHSGWLRLSGHAEKRLKIEHLGFRSQIDQMWATVKEHVREEVFFVNLTSFGAGDSNSNRNLFFDQIRKVVIRAVPRRCFYGQVPFRIGPGNPAIDEKHIGLVPF
jgi:hypothetical protein